MDLGPEVIVLLMGVAFVAGAAPMHAIATNKLQCMFGTASAVIDFASQGRIEFRHFELPA